MKNALETRQLSPQGEEGELEALVKKELENDPNVVIVSDPHAKPEPANPTNVIKPLVEPNAEPKLNADGTPIAEPNPNPTPTPAPSIMQVPDIVNPDGTPAAINPDGTEITEPKLNADGTPIAVIEPGPVFDFGAYGLKEDSPFKSIEDLKPIIERGQQFDGLNQKLTTANGQINDLNTKLDEKLDVFASDEHAEFNAFAKETGNMNFNFFKTLKNADLSTLEGVDKLILQQQSLDQNGNLSKSDLKRAIENQYGLKKKDYSWEEDDTKRERLENQNTEDIENGRTRMIMDANRAENELRELQGKIQKVDLKAAQKAAEDTTIQRNEKLTGDWEPHVTQLMNGMKTIPINGLDDKNAVIKVAEFEVPESDFKELQDRAYHIIRSRGGDPSSENVEQVGAIMRNMVFMKYQNQIIAKTWNKATAEAGKVAEIAHNNPSGDHIPAAQVNLTPAPKKAQTPAEYQAEVERLSLEAVEGGKF